MSNRTMSLRAVVHEPDGDREIVVCGRQTIRTLQALVSSGPRGVTSAEISNWALRTSHYVSQLRHRHGLQILTEREPHDGGEHGRYKLASRVTFIPANSEVQPC